ncbi:MAG: hypothetical protein WA945_03240 [Arcobacteraceae bacterium]
MNKITENEIELLEKQGFEYIYAPEYKIDFEDVLFREKLIKSLTSINPNLAYEQIEYVIKE